MIIFQEYDDLFPCKEIDKDFKDVNQLAQPITLRNEDIEVDYTPKLIEQYILEPEYNTTEIIDPDVQIIEPDQQIKELEQKHPSKYRIKLEILQRPANSEYIGTLYVDSKYKEGENNGSSCR